MTSAIGLSADRFNALSWLGRRRAIGGKVVQYMHDIAIPGHDPRVAGRDPSAPVLVRSLWYSGVRVREHFGIQQLVKTEHAILGGLDARVACWLRSMPGFHRESFEDTLLLPRRSSYAASSKVGARSGGDSTNCGMIKKASQGEFHSEPLVDLCNQLSSINECRPD